MKIEKTKSTARTCVVCGEILKKGDVVIHFSTQYGYQWSYYIAMHLNCVALLNRSIPDLLSEVSPQLREYIRMNEHEEA